MIRWRKVKAVATFEFLSTVRRKGWLIMTLGMPLFMVAYGAIVSVPGYLIEKKKHEVRAWGVVDRPGLLHLEGDVAAAPPRVPEEARRIARATGKEDELEAALRQGNAIFRPYPDEEAAKAALAAGEIRGYYVFPGDWLEKGRVVFVRGEGGGIAGLNGARSQLRRLVISRLLADRVPEKIAERIRNPIAGEEELVVRKGGKVTPGSPAEEVSKVVVPIVFAVLLMISVLSGSGYLLHAVATEKENRLVEILLSSANPDEILAGKLLGLGAAALIQVVAWFGMVVVAGLAFAGALATAGLRVPWEVVALAPPLFVLAYLFVGTLMLATGSIGNTLKESQQYSMLWTILMVLPMVMMGAYIADPQGVVPRVLTWIPFATPVSLMLRVAMDPAGVPWWEIAGPMALLALSGWLALRFGARLFRVGILLTGSRPGLRAILRQARLAP